MTVPSAREHFEPYASALAQPIPAPGGGAAAAVVAALGAATTAMAAGYALDTDTDTDTDTDKLISRLARLRERAWDVADADAAASANLAAHYRQAAAERDLARERRVLHEAAEAASSIVSLVAEAAPLVRRARAVCPAALASDVAVGALLLAAAARAASVTVSINLNAGARVGLDAEVLDALTAARATAEEIATTLDRVAAEVSAGI